MMGLFIGSQRWEYADSYAESDLFFFRWWVGNAYAAYFYILANAPSANETPDTDDDDDACQSCLLISYTPRPAYFPTLVFAVHGSKADQLDDYLPGKPHPKPTNR